MPVLRVLLAVVALSTLTASQQATSFPTEDGGLIFADLYRADLYGADLHGNGTRGVVLAHGGRFTKESWHDQAEALAAHGFRVLALDFRGFGRSRGPGQADFDTAPFQKDVIAAVRYLKAQGAGAVSVVGGSFGGGAAGDAAIEWPGEIDRVVFLGAAPNLSADKLKCRSLFIVARDDASADGPRLPGIRAQYEKASQPKKLIVLDGSAHAQFLFQTDQRARVMREILKFLSAP
jgi:pimeloyl-ACP methyl ester carboxylesterase